MKSWPLPDLDSADDKDDRGTVLVVGGSVSLAGAVVLSGTAALRAGAGRLQLATVKSAALVTAVAIPESLSLGLDETSDGLIDPAAAKAVKSYADQADVVVVGPGMENCPETDSFVENLVSGIEKTTTVIDAGAIAAVGRNRELLQHLQGNAVVTPHAGEMAALMNVSKDAVSRDLYHWATRAASEINAVVALKGARTLIVDPDGRVFEYEGGGIGLATSGSGDTLSGVVAGLLARGASPIQATVWAVFAHGSAGRSLARKIARVGFLARELLDELPGVLESI